MKKECKDSCIFCSYLIEKDEWWCSKFHFRFLEYPPSIYSSCDGCAHNTTREVNT